MEANGYTETRYDHCVFIKKFFGDDYVILLLYADFFGQNMIKIKKLKNKLSKSFAMKDLGIKLNIFLELKLFVIGRTRNSGYHKRNILIRC